MTNSKRSIIVHTEVLNKKTNKMETVMDTSSRQFPIAFTSKDDAAFIQKIGLVTVDTVNYVLSVIKANFFKRLAFTVGDSVRSMTLFDLFGPHKKLGKDETTGNEYDISYDGRPVNISINTYQCREIFNKKTALFDVSSVDVIKDMETSLSGIIGEPVIVPIIYVNESIFNQVDSMLKSFVGRKLNKASGGKDSSWSDACHDAARQLSETDEETEILYKQCLAVGIQSSKFAETGKPAIPEKWTTRLTYRVVDKRFPVPSPEKNLDKFYATYKLAFELFIKKCSDNFPKLSKVSIFQCPSSDVDTENADYTRYYDTAVKLRGIPSTKKTSIVRIRMRTRSGHSKDYYPENLKDAIKKSPKVNIKIPLDETVKPEDLCLPDSCTIPSKHNTLAVIAVELPSYKIEFNEEVFEEHGIGIDVNLADFLFNTTVKPSEISGYVDFVEALATFRKEHPDNVIFTRAPERLVREINKLANHATDKNRTAAFVLLAGVRDGNTVSDQHNWHPAPDYLHAFFKWMTNRKNEDGTPFYDVDQLRIISTNRTVRNQIRLIMTLYHRRKVEQSNWDKTHDPLKETFFDTPEAISGLKEINKHTDDLEQTIQQLVAEALINRIPEERSQFYVMEDVNLNELRNDSHVVSLFRTAQKDWGMTGGKLSVDKSTNTVTFVSKDPTVIPDIADTEYWKVISVKKDGDTTTVVTEPTERFVRQVIQDQVDGSLKKIVRFSGYKHFLESRCIKLGKLMTSVNPKHTSQICHVCRDEKRIAKKADKFSKDQCAEKNLNFRDGRVFICGNPECPMHGIEQNADENAAFNILYKSFEKKHKAKD